MFHVSIREYFSVSNVFIVCICNTARSKSNPLMCTHVDSYMFSTLHPPGILQCIYIDDHPTHEVSKHNSAAQYVCLFGNLCLLPDRPYVPPVKSAMSTVVP